MNRYCTCTVVILAKVVRRAHRAYVLYTSSIASYKALQKQSCTKSWYCLSVQSHVSYFWNSTHCTTYCTVALVVQIPYLLSSFFASFFPPYLPLILVSVQLLFCYCWWFGWALIAPWWILWWLFLLTVGASLPYCMHVWAAWYGSFRTPGVQYRLYRGWCCTTVSCACARCMVW